MRGEILMNTLEFVGRGVATSAAIIFGAFAVGHRGAPLRQLAATLRRIHVEGERKEHELRYYQNMILGLKRDGLMIVQPKNTSWPFALTRKGILKLDELRKRFGSGSFPRSSHYEQQPSATLTIVTFDIPERERHKRDWVRSALKHLSFRMLQKSVWIGKVKIPEAFLADLRRFGIMEKVEILGITKQGTLRQL